MEGKEGKIRTGRMYGGKGRENRMYGGERKEEELEEERWRKSGRKSGIKEWNVCFVGCGGETC